MTACLRPCVHAWVHVNDCVCAVHMCLCVYHPEAVKAVSSEAAQQRTSLCVSDVFEDVCDGSTVFGAILREIKVFPFPLSRSTRTIFAAPVRRIRAQRKCPQCGEVEQGTFTCRWNMLAQVVGVNVSLPPRLIHKSQL